MSIIESELTVFAKTLRKQLGTQHLTALAKDTSFSQRSSPFQGKDLVALCGLLSQSVVTDTLFQLCANLEAESGISRTPQALNERFNSKAVSFLKNVFHSLLRAQTPEVLLPFLAENSPFSRIRLLDATSFLIPETFREIFQGSGGTRHTAGVKIQLEYDLLSGQFLNVDVGPEKGNDKTYGVTCSSTIQKRNLCLRDLGYFDLEELDHLEVQEAYYVFRVKVNTSLFIKNDTPEVFYSTGEIKKHSNFTRVELEPFLTELKPGQTIELPKVYCGRSKRLGARLVIHRLTENQEKSRMLQVEKLTKKRKPLSEKSKRLKGLNIYVTNLPADEIPTELIHDLYSLRWQVEIMFKTWKSIFKINKTKKVKIERLECHLYGQLIALLVTSSTMYKMRHLLYTKHKMELSEYKGMSGSQKYLTPLFQSMQKSCQNVQQLLFRLFHFLKKNGKKSHRYEKKTVLDILINLSSFIIP